MKRFDGEGDMTITSQVVVISVVTSLKITLIALNDLIPSSH